MELKESFLKVYANLPLNLRDEIILVLEGEPITWKVAFLEVKEDTANGDTVLEMLSELDFI